MTSSFGPIGAALLALALTACVQNGAFNDPAATSGATGSTSGPGPTSSGPTTGEPTGSQPPTSEPGSGSEGATGSTGTSTTGPGSSGTSDTTAAIDPSSDSGETTAATDTGPACEGPAEDLCAVDEAAPGYQICQRVATWDQAQAACEARCMRLVVLDAAESDALFDVLRAGLTPEDMQADMTIGDGQEFSERASWWIGGHKIGGVYTWLDGVPMPATGTGGWSPGNPDVADNTACVVLAVFGKGGANGDWFDRDCNNPPHRFICEPVP